jgi:hypothetical protein
MRKTTVATATAILIAAAIGLWIGLAHLATKSATASTDKPATAAMSPFEMMSKSGRELPAGQSADPF